MNNVSLQLATQPPPPPRTGYDMTKADAYDRAPDDRPACPNGDNCDGDIECPVCDRNDIAFLAGADPVLFVLGGLEFLARHEAANPDLAKGLEDALDDLAAQCDQTPAEDLPHVVRGVVHALRLNIPNPPRSAADREAIPTDAPLPKRTAPDVPATSLESMPHSHDPWPTAKVEQPSADTTQATKDRDAAPSESAAARTNTCGHPFHRVDNHHYTEGGAYANHILNALEAIHAGEPASAEINAHAADRILWQHAETCADDLRDFIAGIAGMNERHLESLGTPIHY
jgi:hypothetical protein